MDWNNPGPQTEYNGRRFTAEITFYVPADVTEDEVSEWLEYELGGGMINTDHPMMDAEINRVDVSDCRAENIWSYTDWQAQTEDGRRSGRTRIERSAPPTHPNTES